MTDVMVIQGERMRSDIRAPSRTPRIPTIGYAAQDGWAMSDGGVIRVVRGGNYQVESRPPGAAAVIGPSYRSTTRAVTLADRAAFVRGFMTSSPTSGRGENGGMGQAPMPNEAELTQITRGTEFAERHPMFDAGAVRPAPGGRLWVGRSTGTAGTMEYDVFDQTGRRVSTVALPSGRQVAGIGRSHLYVIAEEDGIERLERYSLPN